LTSRQIDRATIHQEATRCGDAAFPSICNQKRVQAHRAQLFASRRQWRLLCMRFCRSANRIPLCPALHFCAARYQTILFYLSAISAIKSTRDRRERSTREFATCSMRSSLEFSSVLAGSLSARLDNPALLRGIAKQRRFILISKNVRARISPDARCVAASGRGISRTLFERAGRS